MIVQCQCGVLLQCIRRCAPYNSRQLWVYDVRREGSQVTALFTHFAGPILGFLIFGCHSASPDYLYDCVYLIQPQDMIKIWRAWFCQCRTGTDLRIPQRSDRSLHDQPYIDTETDLRSSVTLHRIQDDSHFHALSWGSKYYKVIQIVKGQICYTGPLNYLSELFAHVFAHQIQQDKEWIVCCSIAIKFCITSTPSYLNCLWSYCSPDSPSCDFHIIERG
jgi:hypothetical protein